VSAAADVERDAHAVLLPVLDGLTLPPWARRFLRAGGCGLVLGMSRAEYLARQMSEVRIRHESADDVRRLAVEMQRLVPGPVLLAADQEIGGIGRLHRLVPALPTAAQVAGMSSVEIAWASSEVARAARGLGVTVFLAPIADVVEDNPWLEGRSVRGGPEEVGRVVQAFIKGVRAGGVRTVVKHFPGYPVLAGDPAASVVSLGSTRDDIERSLEPFRLAVGAGAGIVMLGPAPVDAIEPDVPAAASRPLVELLRGPAGFGGVVMSDGLDVPSTLRGQSIQDVAVRCLVAGVDLLMVPGGEDVDRIASAIVQSVEQGALATARLGEAARRVRGLP
jgi:beta-N-acetylhexosaminidase